MFFCRVIILFLLMSSFLFITALPVYSMSRSEPTKADFIKKRVIADFQPYLTDDYTGTLPDLSTLGGISWDYICMTGSYDEGVGTARRGLKDQNLDLSNFEVADERFLDAEKGLVFLNLEQEVLVTIRVDHLTIDMPLGFRAQKKKRNKSCFRAEHFTLSSTIILGERYLKIIEIQGE